LKLSHLLSRHRIIIWDEPVKKEVILQELTEALAKQISLGDPETLLKEVLKREEQGSTFFNEGVAFPHTRISGLMTPAVALGLTRKGVSDVLTEKPVEIVFLILSPAQTPDIQVKVLGLTSRAAQNRQLLQGLESAQTSEEVLTVIRNWETP
jgi:mannitol/fructose-specific phosphotransferase system IIA component (Ntr-type)